MLTLSKESATILSHLHIGIGILESIHQSAMSSVGFWTLHLAPTMFQAFLRPFILEKIILVATLSINIWALLVL